MSFPQRIAAYLAANLAGSWAVGTNVFAGPERAPDQLMPEEAIFIVETEGEEDIYLKGTSGGALKTDGAVVTYRGARGEFKDARTTAKAIYDTLHRKTNVTDYYNVVSIQSAPVPLRSTETMSRWAISFRGERRV